MRRRNASSCGTRPLSAAIRFKSREMDARRADCFPGRTRASRRLPNGDLKTVGEGCWTAFRDAGVGLFWFFDGSHRNVIMMDRSRDKRWTVPLNRAPGFDNPEVYHPRWANHPRFVAISGPYNRGGPNQVRSGGAQAEIYLGRFSADYTRIEAWARVTENAGGDSYPDVWIDRARQSARGRISHGRRQPPRTSPRPRRRRLRSSSRPASPRRLRFRHRDRLRRIVMRWSSTPMRSSRSSKASTRPRRFSSRSGRFATRASSTRRASAPSDRRRACGSSATTRIRNSKESA